MDKNARIIILSRRKANQGQEMPSERMALVSVRRLYALIFRVTSGWYGGKNSSFSRVRNSGEQTHTLAVFRRADSEQSPELLVEKL